MAQQVFVVVGMVGDSSKDDRRQKLSEFLEKLDKVRSGEMLGVTFILDDPAGNSYLQVGLL